MIDASSKAEYGNRALLRILVPWECPNDSWCRSLQWLFWWPRSDGTFAYRAYRCECVRMLAECDEATLLARSVSSCDGERDA